MMLQILHFSDCHLLADPAQTLYGVAPARTLAAVLAVAQHQAADSQMAIITGDLTQDGEAETYVLAERLFASLDRPVYMVPGNHDQPEGMHNALTGQPIVWQRSVVMAGWQMIFLNSAYPDRDIGELPEEELAALEQALQARPDLPSLIFLHHQPMRVGTRWMDQMGLVNADQFFQVLTRHPQVRGVLFGHIHHPIEDYWQDIRLLSAPSTCAQFATGTENMVLATDAPGYRWLRLQLDGQLETGIVRV